MKLGLTLGKFAPLHKGHQLVIVTALAEVDHLLIVIYDVPETTSCPLPVRANWLRTLYPQTEVVEAWDGPIEIGDAPDIRREHEEYIIQLLGGRKVTHFYSSEFYGEHMSRSLGAVDRRVDPSRERVPVSGTLVRGELMSFRAYLDPLVYRDLVVRVVMTGAPSTGKSTLAKALAERFKTVWMPEYGREYWEKHQKSRRLTPEQLVEIAEGHRRREEVLVQQANQFLFVDTDAIITQMFALYYHGHVLPQLAHLADQATVRYDIVFLCEDDIPYNDTWDRSGEVQRCIFQKKLRAELLSRGVPFISLSGPMSSRLQRVERILKGYEKYRPLADHLLNL